jgi:Plasmid encoded RepA protein
LIVGRSHLDRRAAAIRTSSREVELGRSMQIWLGAMGLSIGGKTYRLVTEQARRISGCTLTFYAAERDRELMRRGGFVDGSITMADVFGDGDQPALWQERVLLNEEFYRALRDHPVPVSEAALRAIGPRSMVIDLYIWLAYRRHSLHRDTDIGWAALFAQFGSGFERLRDFRLHFIRCLELALAAYPDARVRIGKDFITLMPSRPAIAKV